MRTLRYLVLSLTVILGVSHADSMPNLVANGGFETGDFSGWTVAGDLGDCLFVGANGATVCDPATAVGGHTGTFAAQMGNSLPATLSQTISTVALPGATFDVSFWLANQSGDPSSYFWVQWGGTTIYSAVNPSQFGYTFFDFSGLNAAGPTTNLTFGFMDQAAYMTLDDISVVDPLPAPEPSTMAIMGLGLAALSVVNYRRKRDRRS